MALTSSLASHLNNPNWRVAAILSINEQQFSVLLPHLIDSLLDADDGVRWAAVIALGRFQRRDMAPMLIPLLDDSSKWVRAATARILGESRVVEAVPHLIKRLCDSDSLARAAAARALGLIGHPSAISGLNGLLSDTERLWDDCGERICNVARQSLQLIYRHLDAIQAALNRGEQIPSDQMERWMSHQLEFGAAREEPVEADPDAPAVLAELPGWLKEQTPAGSDLDNIFAVTGEEFPAAPAVPESTEEAPDPWAEALEYERQHDVSEVPDWYARNITDPDRIAAVNSRLFGEVEEEALEEAALEPEAELPLSQPTEVPDWLCDTMDDAGLFEAAELEEAEPVEAMPDWLAQEMDIAPAVPTPADEIPDWLRAVDADEVPDWLKESLSPAAQAPVPIPPHIAEDTLNFDTMTPEEIMTWMESLAKRQGANKGFTTSAGLEIAEIDPSSVQVDEPGYVSYGIKPQHEVQFSAYYPRQTMAKRRYAFLVYAHLPEIVSEIHQDAGRFRDNLGGEIKTPKTAKKTARLQADTPVTVMLECDELGFEPLALTKRWKLDWVRYDFEFAPSPELVGESFIVRASIMVGSVEVASIKCSIDVVADVAPQVVNNPLAAAKLAYTHAISKMYQRIFVSYSRRDQEVAEMYRLAQLALGNEVFMDSYSIRVGEDWRFALAQAIDNADTFQLFWSENSAGSDNVRDEWDYALRYRCPDTRCESFIRPVFWCQPMPPPPPELAHLHFRFIPFSSTKQWYND